MIDLSIVELAILLAGFVIAGTAIVRHTPRWFAFVVEVGIAFYWLVRVVTDGATMGRVAGVVVFSLLAIHIWWRDLRGPGVDGRPSGP